MHVTWIHIIWMEIQFFELIKFACFGICFMIFVFKLDFDWKFLTNLSSTVFFCCFWIIYSTIYYARWKQSNFFLLIPWTNRSFISNRNSFYNLVIVNKCCFYIFFLTWIIIKKIEVFSSYIKVVSTNLTLIIDPITSFF